MRNIYIPEPRFTTTPISKKIHSDDLKALLALTVVIAVTVFFFGVLSLHFVEVV